MDGRSWKRMVKNEVLPRVPELALSGSILHLSDTEWLLCGAVKNDSAFSKGFTIEVFVMALYEPTDHIGFLVGQRLGHLTEGRDRWWDPAVQPLAAVGADIAARLQTRALPYWERFGDLVSFAAECRARPTFAVDIHYFEWVAGAGVITGDEETARAAFATAGQLRPQREWEVVAQDRVLQLAAIWSDDRAAALSRLREYRDQTVAAIGLR